MSRKNGSPFRKLRPAKPLAKQHPPVQMQLDSLVRGLNRMVMHLSELDLMIEFTMRQMKLTRKVNGGLITNIGGRPQTETITLLELYESQREQFAKQLIEERNAIARAEADAAAATGEVTTGDVDAHEQADRPTGPALVVSSNHEGN